MDRRSFLRSGLGAAVCAGGAMAPESLFGQTPLALQETFGPTPPAASLIPVVGDGKHRSRNYCRVSKEFEL